jgi:hypothetical protein
MRGSLYISGLLILGLLVATRTQPATQPTTRSSAVDGIWKDVKGGKCSITGPDESLVITDAGGHVGHGVYVSSSFLIVGRDQTGNATVKPDGCLIYWSNPTENPPWKKAIAATEPQVTLPPASNPSDR